MPVPDTDDRNVIVNHRHEDAAQIVISGIKKFDYDPKLFIHIVAQQLIARRPVQTLGLGEAASAEAIPEHAFKAQTFVARQDVPALRNGDLSMPAGFLE